MTRFSVWRRLKQPLLNELVHTTYERWAFLFALTSLVSIFAVIALRNFDELFPGANALGDVLYDGSLAYFAAYVFYLIVVGAPAAADRGRFRPILHTAVQRLIGDELSTLEVLAKSTGDPAPNLEEPNVADLCVKARIARGGQRAIVNPDGTYDVRDITIWEHVRERVIRTDKTIERVLRLTPFLDSELIQIIDELESLMLFGQMRDSYVIVTAATNETLEAWTPMFAEYHQVIGRLRDYAARELMQGA